MLKNTTLLIVSLLMILFTPFSVLHANPITGSEALIVTQATITDTDLLFLAAFVGFEPGQTLNYQFLSTSGQSAWSATFSGLYLGTAVDIEYSGNLSVSPGEATATWASSGSYGPDAWSGVGTAIFSDIATGFEVDLNSSATLGLNSGSVTAVITAAHTGSQITYVNTSGSTTINGVSTAGFEYSLDWFLGFIPVNDLIWRCPNCGRTKVVELDTVLFIIPVVIEIGGSGTATTVPEPSALFGLTAGILSLVCLKLLGKTN